MCVCVAPEAAYEGLHSCLKGITVIHIVGQSFCLSLSVCRVFVFEITCFGRLLIMVIKRVTSKLCLEAGGAGGMKREKTLSGKVFI